MNDALVLPPGIHVQFLPGVSTLRPCICGCGALVVTSDVMTFVFDEVSARMEEKLRRRLQEELGLVR